MRDNDSRRTFGLLKAQARQGDIEMMWLVGAAYRDGHFPCVGQKDEVSVRRNIRIAERWFKTSAERHCIGSMIDLAALLYEQGLDATDRETRRMKLVEALRLERMAWRRGEVIAAWNAAITCSALCHRKDCCKWLCNSYRASGDGLDFVALCNASGYGVRKDTAKAMTILMKVERIGKAKECKSRIAPCLLARIRQGAPIKIEEPIVRMIDELDMDRFNIFNRKGLPMQSHRISRRD